MVPSGAVDGTGRGEACRRDRPPGLGPRVPVNLRDSQDQLALCGQSRALGLTLPSSGWSEAGCGVCSKESVMLGDQAQNSCTPVQGARWWGQGRRSFPKEWLPAPCPGQELPGHQGHRRCPRPLSCAECRPGTGLWPGSRGILGPSLTDWAWPVPSGLQALHDLRVLPGVNETLDSCPTT